MMFSVKNIITNQYPDFHLSAFDKIVFGHIETKDGIHLKLRNNILHSANGFAMKTPSGSTVYAKEGLLHNPKGPAFIWKSNDQTRGLLLSNYQGQRIFSHFELDVQQDFEAFFHKNALHRAAKSGGVQEPAVKYANGQQEWWVNGKRHRPSEEGPAVLYPDGSCEYWEDNQLHRPKGPAIINTLKNTKEFWREGEFIKKIKTENGKRFHFDQNDCLHREDGPAIEPINKKTKNAEYGWFIHGNEVPSYDFKVNQNKDGWVHHSWGSYHWKDGALHSLGGEPAVIRHDTGLKIWFKDGLIHRKGKPAWEDPNSHIPQRWFENGEEYNITPLRVAFEAPKQKVKMR